MVFYPLQSLSYEAQIVFVLSICLTSVFILNAFFKKFQFPLMIAPLLLGLLLSFALTENYIPFLPDFKQIVDVFSSLGLMFIMFFIGLKVDFRYIKDLSRNSSIMALNAGLIPFELGFFAAFLYTRDIVTSLFVGLALAITAEEVSISILDELKMLQRRIGQMIIEAGIIGDLFEIGAIALLGLFLKYRTISGAYSLYKIFFELFMFLAIVISLRYYFIELLLKVPGKNARKYEYFGVAFAILLITAVSAEILEFSYIIGALIAGLIIKDKLIDDKLYYEEHHIIEAIEVFNFNIFGPIVFIWIGLSTDTTLLFSNIGFGIILTILALFGKVAGSVIGNLFCKEPFSEGVLIGWGLNARGGAELFAVIIAKNQGIISSEIFSAIVFMTIVTTIISPIVFKFLVSRGYGLVQHDHHSSRKMHMRRAYNIIKPKLP